MNERNLLTVEDLTVNLNNKTIIQRVEFTLKKGSSMGIVGKSGAGKSTLSNVILGAIPAEKGTLTYLGEPIDLSSKQRPAWFRREVQVVFQDASASLNPELSIVDILSEPFHILKLKVSEKQMQQKIQKILKLVELPLNVLHRSPKTLSGGQQQRIALARALTTSPSIIILDESLSSLDVSLQDTMLKLLNRIKEETGVSYLFITHDVAQLCKLCDKLLVLENSTAAQTGDLMNCLERPSSNYLKNVLKLYQMESK